VSDPAEFSKTILVKKISDLVDATIPFKILGVFRRALAEKMTLTALLTPEGKATQVVLEGKSSADLNIDMGANRFVCPGPNMFIWYTDKQRLAVSKKALASLGKDELEGIKKQFGLVSYNTLKAMRTVIKSLKQEEDIEEMEPLSFSLAWCLAKGIPLDKAIALAIFVTEDTDWFSPRVPGTHE